LVVAGGARLRILEATYTCVARYGLAKTTVEDAARASGMARATIYRYFPGGRDQLVAEVIAWEAARFFDRLAAAVGDTEGLEELLEEALFFAHQAVEEHEVLQKILQTEPDRLLPQLTVESTRILAYIRAFLMPHMEAQSRAAGLDPEEAADFVARMLLSFTGSPGRWDLSDRAQVTELVRTEVLAALHPLPTPGTGVTDDTMRPT
jgi:AcrR family transcriptional regulator